MLLMSGAKEETTNIINDICQKTDSRFFHINDNGGFNDLRKLFMDINGVMQNAPEDKQWESIRKIIKEFNDAKSTDKLSENIQAMSIYQKVVLHQSSHGHEGLPNLSEKEIKASIAVMKNIEGTIKKMKIERI